MYIGTSNTDYDLIDMYKTADGSYNARNSGPSHPNYAERLFSSSWADTGGYSKIISVNANTIVVRLYRSSTISFPSVYRMVFRFYAERLSFSGCNSGSVNMYNSRHGSNFRTFSGCDTSGRHFWLTYDYWSTPSYSVNPSWPTWYGGDYFDFTVSFSSISGDSTNDPAQLYISTTINYFKARWYYRD